MSRRPNRVILTIVSILLIALGLIPLLAAAGVIPLEDPSEWYLDMAAGADAYPWAWSLGVIAGGLLLAALGAWLVARQLRGRPGGRLDTVVVQRRDGGRTTLQAAAAANAAAKDLRRKSPIADSGVRMVTYGSRPRLFVVLDISPETDPHRALDAAEDVYGRLADVLGADALSVDTRLRLTSRGGGDSRVQ